MIDAAGSVKIIDIGSTGITGLAEASPSGIHDAAAYCGPKARIIDIRSASPISAGWPGLPRQFGETPSLTLRHPH